MSGNDTGIKPIVLDQIVEIAKQYDLDRVILFGSRARGDYKRTSDIDLAIRGGNSDRFTLAVEEETDTLLKYDVVNMDSSVPEELLQSIDKEGVIIYEKI